jgi:hypothetical protein
VRCTAAVSTFTVSAILRSVVSVEQNGDVVDIGDSIAQVTDPANIIGSIAWTKARLTSAWAVDASWDRSSFSTCVELKSMTIRPA